MGVRSFFTDIKGAPSARQAGPGPAGVVCKDAEISRGNRELERRENRQSQAGGNRGTRLLRGGSMPRPTGGSPPGAALPPVSCPRSPQAAGAGSNAPAVTAPARAGRAVVLTPGAPIAVRTSQVPGRNAAHCPGRPLRRQGHPKVLSNRSAERIFGTHP